MNEPDADAATSDRGSGPRESVAGGQDADAGRASSEVREPIDRRRLDEIFGDVLPEVTGDERAESSRSGGYSEQWYRENTPPHHSG